MSEIENLKGRLLANTTVLDNGCWHCSLGGEGSKYGHVWYINCNISNHRASWLAHKGPIPESILVCHSCDYKRCINPEHLFLGTEMDNIHDCMNKGRRDVRVGSRNPSAKLTEEQVREIKYRYADSDLSQRQIGELFGVGPTIISQIKSGVRWPHV